MQIKVNVGRRRVGLAVATLLLGGAIGSAASSAVATSPASSADFGSASPSGYLALQLRTDSSGVVSGKVLQYSESTGSPAALIDTQTFSVTKCAVTTDGRLLRFESSTGKVGLYNNGLGTKTKGTCSPAEGRTAAGETFTVSLGSKFGPSYSIDSSELDIEGKFSANLLWTAVNGSTPVGTGSASVASSTDNGPDAGTGDNTIVTIGSKDVAGDNYTSLTLSTAEGEFGLDGGGDGTYPAQNSIGTNDSVLFLSSSVYGYTVDCGEIINATDADLAASDAVDDDDSRVSELAFLRLANKDQTDCAPIGVTVSASDTPRLDGAYFDHSTTSAAGDLQNVRARVKIVWTVEMEGKSQAQIDAELAREVLFAVDGQPVPVSNCLHVPAGVAENPLDPSSTAVIDHPDDTPWCLMSDARLVSGNTIIQTQYYSGNGDPRFF
jgi:hypothetical protein